MTKINYHSPLVHGTQGAGVDLISIPSEQLYSVPKKRKILLAKLVLISTHVGNQNREWLVRGTGEKAKLWKQGGQGKDCGMKLKEGPIIWALWALTWSLKFIVSIKGSSGY